jgi:UDP-glucose 4-epimerase
MAATSSSSGPAVLVVGAGFTGAETVRRLAHGDRPVRVVSRRSHPEVAALLGNDAWIGDAADSDLCARAIDGCDTVVWCAGDLVPTSTSSDLATIDDVTPLATMLRVLSERGSGRFVFISSGGTVYGRPNRLPVPESEPVKPLTVYAAMKVLSERCIATFRAKGVDATVLRVANVYGPTQTVRESHGVIVRALHCARSGTPFPMIGTANSTRDYVYIDDFVDVVQACIDRRITAPVVNVGSGVPTSLSDLVKMIDVVVGGLDTETQPARPSDLDRIVLDISLLRSQLPDFEPTPLSIGLERTWAAVSASPH